MFSSKVSDVFHLERNKNSPLHANTTSHGFFENMNNTCMLVTHDSSLGLFSEQSKVFQVCGFTIHLVDICAHNMESCGYLSSNNLYLLTSS